MAIVLDGTSGITTPDATINSVPVVSTTATQTLTNKTLTSPILSGAPLLTNTTSGNGAIIGEQTFLLTSNGTAIAGTLADFFGPNSSISLEAASIYEFTFNCYFLRSGAIPVQGTFRWTLTASSAPTTMLMSWIGNSGAGGFTGTALTSSNQLWFATSTGQVSTASQNTTTATTADTTTSNWPLSGGNHLHIWKAYVNTNLATNIRLQLTASLGSTTPLAGSYYTVKKISATTGTFVA